MDSKVAVSENKDGFEIIKKILSKFIRMANQIQLNA